MSEFLFCACGSISLHNFVLSVCWSINYMSQEVSKLLFMFVEFVVLAWEYSFLQFFPNIMCLQISIVCFNVQFIVIELLCLFGSNLPVILLQRYMLVVFCLFWKMAAYLSLSFWFVQLPSLTQK